MSWMQKRPRYDTRFVTSVEAGLQYLEETRKMRLPILRGMADELLARATPEARERLRHAG
jgi:hypothetical protein